MYTYHRYQKARKCLIFWCLFVGIGAVVGSVSMLWAPDGSILHMQGMLPYFQVLPFAKYLFQDYIFSGCALLIVNGLTNLTAAVLLLRQRKSGILLGGIFGITLMLWICIQFCIFPVNVLSTSYFIFGLIQAGTGYAAWVFYQQEQYQVTEKDYPKIGTNPKELVVYFSRMGYTKRAALEKANQSGALLYEIVSTERTGGTLGFWWCGRYGMHGWSMPIEEVSIPLDQFEKVTICSPIWVFGLAAPVRRFCELASGKIKRVDYVLVHHQKNRYENALAEMDQKLGIHYEHAESICCRLGRQRKVEQINGRG